MIFKYNKIPPNNNMTKDCVQFLASIDNGMLTELGRFDEQAILRQNRIDKILTGLIDQNIISFSHDNVDKNSAGVSSADSNLSLDQSDKKKIKPTIRLKR